MADPPNQFFAVSGLPDKVWITLLLASRNSIFGLPVCFDNERTGEWMAWRRPAGAKALS